MVTSLIRYVLFFNFVGILAGCNRVSYRYAPLNTNYKNAEINNLFLVFSIKGDSLKQKASLELVSKKETEGIAKRQINSTIPGDKLVFTQLTKNHIVVTMTEIEHPLAKGFEHIDPRGQLAKKKVFLEQAEFFIRLSVTRVTAFIKIDELRSGKKTTLLIIDR